MTTFRELGLSAAVLKSIAEMGFEEPTPVQEQAIPSLMQGRDVVAQALTGTGKTAAFGIPLVERVEVGRAGPQAVVLAPTRELALQVAEQISRLGRHRGVLLVPIYGGQPYERQLRALRRGVHVIVATPGRLLDHMRRGTADLSGVRMLVLDEADQMLDMGFLEDVEAIMAGMPAEKVTALFSATMPQPILELSRKYMREPELLRLSKPQALTVPEVDQVYYEVPFRRKMDALCRVLDARRPERSIVFCATKRMVDEVVDGLQAHGYVAEGLHGDMSQSAREKVLRAFRQGRAEVLVATDVAARGLDIPEVSHVINFDIPPDPDYYVHRIGRTARLGRSGQAITFVNPREIRVLKSIERLTGASIRREEVPTAAEVEEREAQILEERLLETLAAGRWGPFRELVEELAEEHDPVDIAAAALSLVPSRLAATRAPAPAPEREEVQPPAAEPRAPAWRERERPAAEPRREPPWERERPGREPGAEGRWEREHPPARGERREARGERRGEPSTERREERRWERPGWEARGERRWERPAAERREEREARRGEPSTERREERRASWQRERPAAPEREARQAGRGREAREPKGRAGERRGGEAWPRAEEKPWVAREPSGFRKPRRAEGPWAGRKRTGASKPPRSGKSRPPSAQQRSGKKRRGG